MDRDTDYIDADGYRANVGIVLMNDDRQVTCYSLVTEPVGKRS